MKRFRIGFTALAALVSMSFVWQNKLTSYPSRIMKAEVTAGCFLSIDLHVPDPYGNPWSLTVVLTKGNVTLYSTNYLYQVVGNDYDMGVWYLPGYTLPLGIYSYWPGTVVNDFTVADVDDGAINPAIWCPSPYQVFCCFKVERDYYDNSKYRVTGVALKAMQQ